MKFNKILLILVILSIFNSIKIRYVLKHNEDIEDSAIDREDGNEKQEEDLRYDLNDPYITDLNDTNTNSNADIDLNNFTNNVEQNDTKSNIEINDINVNNTTITNKTEILDNSNKTLITNLTNLTTQITNNTKTLILKTNTEFIRKFTVSSCLNSCDKIFTDCSCKKECEKEQNCCSDYSNCKIIQTIQAQGNSSNSLKDCEFSNTDQSACLQCKTNIYLYNNQCTEKCTKISIINNINFVCTDKTCELENCEKCDDRNKRCSKCKRGNFLSDGRCVKICPESTYADRESWKCKHKREHSFYIISPSIYSCKDKCNSENSGWDCSCKKQCVTQGNCCGDFNDECINLLEATLNFTNSNQTSTHIHSKYSNHSDYLNNKTFENFTLEGKFDLNIIDNEKGVDKFLNNIFHNVFTDVNLNESLSNFTNTKSESFNNKNGKNKLKNEYTINYIKDNKEVKFVNQHIENINSNNHITIYK